MSAFLGPIHSWLYGKIVFQNQLVKELYGLAMEKDWNLSAYQSDRYGELPEGELVDIIDENNIHGWLQDKVSLVENKLAYLVTLLTEEKEDRITEIVKGAKAFGRKNSFEGGTVSQAYTHLENLLLNGMPCDRVNQKEEADEHHITWRQVVNIYAHYWEQIGGKVSFYDRIRNGLIAGMLEGSGIVLHVDGDTYSIISEG